MFKPLCPSVVVPARQNAREICNWRAFLEREGQQIVDLATNSTVSDEKLQEISQRENPAPIRLVATCQSQFCGHFSQGKCGLARGIVENLEIVTQNLPSCEIRGRCRWWRQEGESACLRCPGVETIASGEKMENLRVLEFSQAQKK